MEYEHERTLALIYKCIVRNCGHETSRSSSFDTLFAYSPPFVIDFIIEYHTEFVQVL
jgi:hypothetical protein